MDTPSNPLDLLTRLTDARAALDDLAARLRDARCAAARRRFTASSPDGTAVAVVDGVGTLLDLRLSTACLRGPHPALIGPAVVAAVAAARTAAVADWTDRVGAALPGTVAA